MKIVPALDDRWTADDGWYHLLLGVYPGLEIPMVPVRPMLSYVGASGQVTVSHNVDSTATSYQYRVDGGTWQAWGEGTSVIISGLTDGTTYLIEVQAQNSEGDSEIASLYVIPGERDRNHFDWVMGLKHAKQFGQL